MNASHPTSARVGGASLLLLTLPVRESMDLWMPSSAWVALWAWGTLLGVTGLLIWFGTGMLLWPEDYTA